MDVRGSITVTRKALCLSQSDQIFNEFWAYFSRDERPGREADSSPHLASRFYVVLHIP